MQRPKKYSGPTIDGFYKDENGEWHLQLKYLAADFKKEPSESIKLRWEKMHQPPQRKAEVPVQQTKKQSKLNDPNGNGKKPEEVRSKKDKSTKSIDEERERIDTNAPTKVAKKAKNNNPVALNQQVPSSSSPILEGNANRVIVTNSTEMIYPLRKKLKQHNSVAFKKLLPRMKLRNLVMNKPRKEEPFKNNGGLTEEQLLKLRQNHGQIGKESKKLVIQFNKIDIINEKYSNSEVGEKRKIKLRCKPLKRPVKHLNVEELTDFASAKKMNVFNLDMFVTATDKRRITIVDGKCIYCKAHGVLMSGQMHSECPYLHCACVACYVADRMK